MPLPLTSSVILGITILALGAGAINGLAGFGFALVGTMALATVVDPAVTHCRFRRYANRIAVTLIGERALD